MRKNFFQASFFPAVTEVGDLFFGVVARCPLQFIGAKNLCSVDVQVLGRGDSKIVVFAGRYVGAKEPPTGSIAERFICAIVI